MTSPIEYAAQNAEAFRKQLHDLIRIPSVSTDPSRKGDVRRAAEWLAADLNRIGAQAEVLPTNGHPVVYAEWLGAGADKPTILVYGHYDVQPADREKDGWNSDPFEPVERDGKIFARGSSDDKGQAFIHVKALESYLKTTGSAPVNVKFLLEGEEEIGSPNLAPFVAANRDRLKADMVVISDTGMRDINQPAITYALRGLTYMEIHVYGPNTDKHSGGYGGIVHNPALALAHILTKMHNADNSIAVPGFYDDVLPLTDDERAVIRQSDITEAKLYEETGVAPWGEAGYTIRERQTARPTLEINGLFSGFIGEGSKTVLPARAMAKVSCRLVANQDPRKIYELVRDYVAQITPPTVRSEVKLLSVGDAARIDYTTPPMQAAVRAYQRGWGTAPIFTREGGSIPIVADFKRELGLDSLLLGFGLNTDGAHGPDEHYTIEMFHKGIDTTIYFLQELTK